MSLPDQPARLSDEMATAVGHAVSAFGFLEEALKRAIFALTREDLGEEVSDAAMRKWLRRMEDIADDTLGTLIDSFVSAMRLAQVDERGKLASDLTEIRVKRNLLCHASWRPGAKEGYWHPLFINTRGEAYPDDMSAEDVNQIHALTQTAIRRVVSIMHETGIDGKWAGLEDSDDAKK